MEDLSEKKFPVDAKDYKLCEEVGDGVSATVYKALCIPLKKLVAIKVLDLEKCNNGLEEIVKLTKYEEQTSGKHSESAELGQVDPLQVSPETIRERELQSQIYQLQESLGNLLEELQLQKWKNAQLERQLNSNVNKGT